MQKAVKPIGIVQATMLFFLPGLLFWVHLTWSVPYVASIGRLGTYAAWVIVGTFFLFVPLFLLALYLLKKDNYRLDWHTIASRLRISKPNKTDWQWIFFGLFTAVVLIGGIIALLVVLPLNIDVSRLKEISPIETQPLIGRERFIFLLLPVFFFFNYVGEEILWRGYILPRQEVALGQHAWVINGVLHGVFHLSFGILTLVVTLPFLLLIPFVVYKTKNTTTAIILHALVGAPMQIFVSLGFLS